MVFHLFPREEHVQFCVKYGNGNRGEKLANHVAITKSYHQKWIGKRVKSRLAIREGRIAYLTTWSREEVALLDLGERVLHPFRVYIHWNSGVKSIVVLSSLEFVEEVEKSSD